MKNILSFAAITIFAFGTFVSSSVFAETIEVQIIKSAFFPYVVKIKKGDTIRWVNRDGLLHTVTSGKAPIHDGHFKGSYVLKEYKTSINLTGMIDYFCELHNGTMRGVIVTEESQKSPGFNLEELSKP